MNFDDIFNAKNMNGISPEKLAFLKAMSNKQTGNNMQDIMAALMSVSNAAQQQGVTFTEPERDAMLELLLKNLPPNESAKARTMVQMMKQMQKKK